MRRRRPLGGSGTATPGEWIRWCGCCCRSGFIGHQRRWLPVATSLSAERIVACRWKCWQSLPSSASYRLGLCVYRPSLMCPFASVLPYPPTLSGTSCSIPARLKSYDENNHVRPDPRPSPPMCWSIVDPVRRQVRRVRRTSHRYASASRGCPSVQDPVPQRGNVDP